MLNFNRKYLSLLALFATSVVVNANEAVVKFIPGYGFESVQLQSIKCRNATNTNWENHRNEPINESGNSTLTIDALTTLNPDFASTFNSNGSANKPSIATGAYYDNKPGALYSVTKIQLKLNSDTMIDNIFYLGQGHNFYGRKNWWLASTKGNLYQTPKYPGWPRRNGITVQDANHQEYCIYAYQDDLSVNAFMINRGACTTKKNKKAINVWSKTSKVVGGAAGALTIIGGAVGATVAVLANQHANNNQPALFNGTHSNGTDFGDYFNATLPGNGTLGTDYDMQDNLVQGNNTDIQEIVGDLTEFNATAGAIPVQTNQLSTALSHSSSTPGLSTDSATTSATSSSVASSSASSKPIQQYQPDPVCDTSDSTYLKCGVTYNDRSCKPSKLGGRCTTEIKHKNIWGLDQDNKYFKMHGKSNGGRFETTSKEHELKAACDRARNKEFYWGGDISTDSMKASNGARPFYGAYPIGYC